MLLLLFQIGSDRYALDTAEVVEVVPRVTVKKVPGAPPGVAGLLDYHGAAAPVLDLRELTTGEPSETRYSTRTILVRAVLEPHDRKGAGDSTVVGLLAERATGTTTRNKADFVETHLRVPGAPYLGPVIPDAGGFIQFVGVAGLVAGAVRNLLGEPAVPEEVFA